MKIIKILIGIASIAASYVGMADTADDYPYQPPAASAPGYGYQQPPQYNYGYPENNEYIDNGQRIIRRQDYYNGQPNYPGNYPGYSGNGQPNYNPNVLNDPSRGAFRYYNGYQDTFRTPPAYAPAPGYNTPFPPPANAYPQNPGFRGNWNRR